MVFALFVLFRGYSFREQNTDEQDLIPTDSSRTTKQVSPKSHATVTQPALDDSFVIHSAEVTREVGLESTQTRISRIHCVPQAPWMGNGLLPRNDLEGRNKRYSYFAGGAVIQVS